MGDTKVETNVFTRSRRTALLAVVPIVLAAALFGYFLGFSQTSQRTLVGEAHSGIRVVSIKTSGGTYGARGNVDWYDNNGTLHVDGWPDCLRVAETRNVRFSAMRTGRLAGGAAGPLIWIDCRPVR